jgi:hypothetical protein
VRIDETYIVGNNNDTVLSTTLDMREPSMTLLDPSTIVNETRHDHLNKANGSSIQVHINPAEETIEEIPPTMPSNSQHRFQSIVLAMTALRDQQKV